MAAVLQILGAAAITAGAAFWSPVAGFIVGGIFLVMFGLALSRGDR